MTGRHQPRYPIYIPSKGRHANPITARVLARDDVPFYVVVEPPEREAYERAIGRDHVLTLPFADLGLLHARNWIRDHAEAAGHGRHWQLDDNISAFHRFWEGERIPVHAGVALRVAEDFADRYENIGVSGLSYTMFVPRHTRSPFCRNVHVYSCTLINHAMPYRWRLRYNDDTDLCLQALVHGWGTVALNAFSAQKTRTMVVAGGNTDTLYRTEEDGEARDTMGRYEMARALERAWPEIVRVTRAFGRYQHSVNWNAFADVRWRPRSDVDPVRLPATNEYGLVLRELRSDAEHSDLVRRLRDGYLPIIGTPPLDPEWRDLPTFRAPPIPPKLRIVCATSEDRDALVEQLAVTIAKKTGPAWSAWWPPRPRPQIAASLRFEPESVDASKQYRRRASRSMPRYPIYVPSKGRYEDGAALTVQALARDEVPFRLVVEPAQAAEYRRHISDRDQLLVLPEDDFGLLRARNWIRDHAEASGAARHWQLDDNISDFYRLWERKRIPVHAGVALRVCEDFTDRYENVGISGLNYDMFVNPNGSSGVNEPFLAGSHVYSCTLVNHAMPYRWRLRYNDDTDLCLQALVHGWATILLNAFSAKKVTTMTLAGGNTDALYRAEAETDARDTAGRYEMARSLERAWPGTVRVVRNYGRYQHSVNWGAFDVPLRLRGDVDPYALPDVDEYGLALRTRRPVRSDRIRAVHDAYPQRVAAMGAPSETWRGLPAFAPAPPPPKLVVRCATPEDREHLVEQLAVLVDKKFKDKGWSAWWPARGREDPASLRFEAEDPPEVVSEDERGQLRLWV